MIPALRSLSTPGGVLTWREAGSGPALVLLHGIGSGAASFEGQFDGLADSHRVIAWDAPGYGESAPLAIDRPLAADYAAALDTLLRHLQVRELVLLGHSLGALVAAAWAARPAAAGATPAPTLRALLLAHPARGYGSEPAAVQAARWQERVELMENLGAEGLAAARSANLCAPGAAPAALEAVRRNMARVTPRGYGQAAHLLAHDALLPYLRQAQVPTAVCSGEHDRITPPAACRALADAVNAPFTLLHGVGHASYVEDARQFNALLRACLARLQVTTDRETS
ncbi:alpha/beta fold hydrolase [Aquabacterium sp.]|uniref:alpha/beta fold hydrolase n=1 Tax=Aquabacterium sp. TaxID=1872578 RepID=UPI003784B7CE